MHATGNKLFSLLGCYVLPALAAACFLLPALLFAGAGYAAHVGGPVSAFAAGELRAALGDLRSRMHESWLFLAIFFAFWGAVLLWLLAASARRRMHIGSKEVRWMAWMSLWVASAAFLYGVGTNGILARRFVRLPAVSDVLAAGFLLALPALAWRRLQQSADAVAEGGTPSLAGAPRSTGFLGLSEIPPQSTPLAVPAESMAGPRPPWLSFAASDASAARPLHATAGGSRTVATLEMLVRSADFPASAQEPASGAALHGAAPGALPVSTLEMLVESAEGQVLFAPVADTEIPRAAEAGNAIEPEPLAEPAAGLAAVAVEAGSGEPGTSAEPADSQPSALARALAPERIVEPTDSSEPPQPYAPEETDMEEPQLHEGGTPTAAESVPGACGPSLTLAPGTAGAGSPVPEAIDVFRRHLAAINSGWQDIEQNGRAIEAWFEEQQRQVTRRLSLPPALRASEPPPALSDSFLSERLRAVDRQWEQIRSAALALAQWFGDAPSGRD